MRKLMWFTIGFAAACAVGVYLQLHTWCLLIGLFCLIGCTASFFLKTKPARITAVVLLGCVFGFCWLWGYDSLYLSNARDYDGESVNLTITATDYGYATNYGQAFDGYTELHGKRYQVRCYLNENIDIAPGKIVSGEFRLRFTSRGGEREPTYHQGKGIFLITSQKSDVTVTGGEPRILDYPAIWRHRILQITETVFPTDTVGFAKALLLGDTTGFTYRQDRAFQVSGLRHIVAVSGLHVSILFSLIYMVFGHRRVWNAIFGIPLLLIFAAMAGFTPSIIRACLMQGLILIAMLTDKEYDPVTALAFAVLVILAVNPMSITSVSLQLSVGCMIGIFAFSEPLRQYLLSFGNLKEKSKGKSWRAKIIRWLTGSVSVSVSAMAFTTPLCAIYFGLVSLVGILANILTLWVISFIFYGIMLACLFAALWTPLAEIVAWLVAWPIRYVLAVSGFLADFPLAAVYTDSVYIICWLILSYGMLFAFFSLKKQYPGMTVLGVLVLLVVCIALSWLEPALDDTRVSVINVGQGQSILIQQGHERYLVDCGGEHSGITADTVSNFLLSQGVFQLDGVIITHYDADHAGSLLNLLTCVNTESIYIPDIFDSNGIREMIQEAYPENIRLICNSEQLRLETGKITLFPGEQKADDNENSVCVLFQSQNCDILITGDRSEAGERALLKQMQIPKLELLIAGHHGSDRATSLDLLLETRPKAVAISVGSNNRYGHPGQELLERLTRFGCEIYRTDLQGTIIFRG